MVFLLRVVRAPFVLISLLVGTILLFGFLSSISMGEWFELALRRLGHRGNPYWLSGALGVVAYLGLGLVLPAIGGNAVIGWPGMIVGPVVAVLIISRLGRW